MVWIAAPICMIYSGKVAIKLLNKLASDPVAYS